MGMENGRGIISPLYAGGNAHGAAAGHGRTAANHGPAAKGPGVPPGSPRTGQNAPGHSNPQGMGSGPSGRVISSHGHRYAGGSPRQNPVGARPPAYHTARAGLMMCVGALVVAAMIRQYEVWTVDDDRPVLRADVVPGIFPDDPIVTFRIGQR